MPLSLRRLGRSSVARLIEYHILSQHLIHPFSLTKLIGLDPLRVYEFRQ